jgi:hypothetical protein
LLTDEIGHFETFIHQESEAIEHLIVSKEPSSNKWIQMKKMVDMYFKCRLILSRYLALKYVVALIVLNLVITYHKATVPAWG